MAARELQSLIETFSEANFADALPNEQIEELRKIRQIFLNRVYPHPTEENEYIPFLYRNIDEMLGGLTQT